MSSSGLPRTLAGRYRLDKVIGRGGMSTVYRATDLSLDRVVAVKVAMDPLLERDPVYAARFKREARAAASVSNPGIVTVFDAGADGPTRYIVMECVDGRDLSQILRDEGPLEPTRAAHIAEQIADTLAAAHAAGVVHRDIKPGNVMVTPQGTVKVLDFGIARTTDGVTLTQTASVLGTAPYMSPEQAMGQPADARSDIYSLGCVLYEMLTGSPPFMGDLPAAVLHQHVRVAPKAPRAVNPDVPPALDALVLRMLAKAPEDRPQTAAEVRDALATLDTTTEPTRPLPPAEALAAVAADAAEVPQVATVSQVETPAADPVPPTRRVTPPGRSPRRDAGPWVVLAVVAVLLLGAAVAYAITSGGSSSTSSTSSHSTGHTAAPATQSASSTSTPSSTSSTSSSTTTSTSTTTSSTPTTTVTTPGPPAGGPPGKAKKDKKHPTPPPGG